MSSGLSKVWEEEIRPMTDDANMVIGQYLAGLIPDMNFRLFCDMEAGAYGFPKTILWVEGITIYEGKEQNAGGGDRENDCQEQGLLEELKERTLTGQIKYKLKQIKHYFAELWKKKGR